MCYVANNKTGTVGPMANKLAVLPVRNEEREGQHIGVEVNAFLKLAPPARRIFIVFGMNSKEPEWWKKKIH